MSGFDDRNVIGLIQAAVESRFEQSWAKPLSFFNPNSDRALESYGIFGGYSKLREWLGGRNANNPGQKSWEVRNKKYEGTLVVSNDDLRRDKSNLLQTYVDNWVEGTIAYHWEDLLIDLINAGGSANCFDGQYFFDTDHQFGSETAQKNLLTASEVTALNITTTTDPTPSEFASAIMGVVGYMMTFTDDKGRYVNGNAREFTIAVSTPNLWAPLTTALSSNILTDVVDNPMNGLKIGGLMFKPLLVPNLTSATSKFRVFRTDGANKPFILQEELGLQYKALTQGSDFEFENDAIKIGVNTNRGASYGDWKMAADATFS